MSALSALLNAQRRPDHEAAKLTEAFDDALTEASESAEGTSPAEMSASALSAYRLANQRIADEKLPAAPSQNAAERGEPVRAFDEDEPSQFSDAETSEAPESSYTDDHYLLTDDEDDRTGLEMSAAPQAESSIAHPAAPPTADATTPPAERLDEPSDQIALGDEPDGYEPGEYADHEQGEPDDDADSGDGQDESDGFAQDPAEEELPGVSGEDVTMNPVGPVVSIPSATDAYASSRTWDDQQEIDPDDEPQETLGEQAESTRLTPPEVTPAPVATDPPDDITDPDAVPESGLKERVLDGFSEATRWARDNRKKMALYGGILGAAVLVIGGLFSSVNSHRGRPPLPANTIAAQPPDTENPTKPAEDKTLIPAMVSASCGNDSDAVGPFSVNKKRAWLCVRINGRDLNVLNIIFDGPVVITKICVVPGWDYVAPDGRDEWVLHRLTTGVTWRMGGAVYPQAITPTRTGVCKEFPSVITTQMSMTITASERPPVGSGAMSGGGIGNEQDDQSKVDVDTAIGSIVIEGHPVNPEGS